MHIRRYVRNVSQRDTCILVIVGGPFTTLAKDHGLGGAYCRNLVENEGSW